MVTEYCVTVGSPTISAAEIEDGKAEAIAVISRRAEPRAAK
jgi:hypothetical protein